MVAEQIDRASKARDLSGARDWAERFFVDTDRSLGAANWLCEALLAVGDAGKALAVLEVADLGKRTLQPHQLDSLALRAQARIMLHERAAARRDIDRLYALDPVHPDLGRLELLFAGEQHSVTCSRGIPEAMEFEEMCQKYLATRGWKVRPTGRTRDGGYDIDAAKDGRRILVECKAHRAPVGVKVVRELAGVVRDVRADGGIVCSFSGFTQGAAQFASANGIELLDAGQLGLG